MFCCCTITGGRIRAVESSEPASAVRYCLIALLLCVVATQATAQDPAPYRILLSNDDGIASPLLHALYAVVRELPAVEAVVAAPAVNQSGSSQSTQGGELLVERYRVDGAFFGYAVHGRPADAVRFAIKELAGDEPFDLVISGINRGANVGDVSHLSGTVGAAMEALYQGVPAIAVSQDVDGVDTGATARFVAQLIARYRSEGAPDGVLISVNVPGGEIRGVRVRPMGDSYLQTDRYTLLEEDGDRLLYEGERRIVQSSDESTDTYAYQQGYITLTPLRFDWTASDFLDEVTSWGLTLPD